MCAVSVGRRGHRIRALPLALDSCSGRAGERVVLSEAALADAVRRGERSIEIVLHVIMCLGSCTPPWHPGADPCEMSDVGSRELLGGVARRSGCGLSEGDTGLTGVADAVRHGSGRAAAGPRSRV